MTNNRPRAIDSNVTELYPAHLEIERRNIDQALAASGFEALAIFAGRQRAQFLDDQPYPFKVNPHFKLWTPLQEAADCWIVYRPVEPLKLVFLQPFDYWYKSPEIPNDFWTKHFQLEIIRETAEAKMHVSGIPHCAFIGEWQHEFEDWEFTARNPESVLRHLHYARASKTEYQIECMRRASAMAACAHRAAESAFRAGLSEYEIHMAYLRALQQTENELPYPNIVALNGNAAVLHYQNLERAAPSELHSFLIDAGAEFAGHAADVTRSYSYRDDDFDALIRRMDSMQQELCSQVRAGVDYTSIHLDAHRRIGNVLEDMELITVSGTDAAVRGLTSVFFPHGIGHLLGLQVHDVGGFAAGLDGSEKHPPPGHPYLRLTRTLEPGFVVTIEPGLYFIDALLDEARASAYAKHINWRQVERFKQYGGIRIEDNVVCTMGAAENLTRSAFATFV